MGSKGSQTTTQNQVYTPDPRVKGAGYEAIGMAQNAAQLPFQQQQAPVAGFTDDQMSAFALGRNAPQYAQPYIQAGASLIGQSAQPISAEQTNNYLNPYANYVLGNMRDSAGQQMSQTTGKLTQAAGGVGADRIGVAQANLAKQQQLAEGQTLAGIYGNALGAAQQDAGRQQSAGFGLGQLGMAGQNALIQGTQALYGQGALQQQQAQAEANAPYQWDLARIAHQYQMPQYLAGITGSMAPALGGTTNTQTTAPAPSPWGTIAGLGMTAAGAMMGNPMMMGSGMKGMGATAPQSMGMTAGGYGMGGWNPNVSGGWVSPGYYAARGGAVGRAQGGRVTPLDVFRTFAGGGVIEMQKGADGSYADGGEVPWDMEDRFGAISDVPLGRGMGADYNEPVPGPNADPALQAQIDTALDSGAPLPESASVLPPPVPRLPRQITNPDNMPDDTGAGMAYGPGGPRVSPARGAPPPPVPMDDGPGLVPEEEPSAFQKWQRGPGFALMQAGLGTLAAAGKRDSRGIPLSPWAAIGEGGMKGVEVTKTQEAHSQQRRRIQLEAQRLLNQAEHQRKTLDETKRYHDLMDADRVDRRTEASTRNQILEQHRRDQLEAQRQARRDQMDPSRQSPVQQALIRRTEEKGSPLTAAEIAEEYTKFQRPAANSQRPPTPVQQALAAREKEKGSPLTSDEIIAVQNGIRTGPGAEIPEDEGAVSDLLTSDDVTPNFKGALGASGMGTRGANAVTGFLGSQAYPQEAKATRVLDDLAVRTQQTLNNVAGRPSNYWLQRIGTLTVDPKKWNEGPDSARTRLAQTKNTIQTEIDRTESVLKSPNTSKTSRDKATKSLLELRTLKADYDAVLEAWPTGENPLTPAGEAVRDVLPSGPEVRDRAVQATGAAPKGAPPQRPKGVPPEAKLKRNPRTGERRWFLPDGTSVPHTQ